MEREEAIRRLRYIRMDYLGYPPFLEPIDMAIEALSAEVNLYALPKAITVRPLTEEIAIEFLQDSGWLQKHDKEIGNPPMLVRCKDCRHANECHKSVQHTRNEQNTVTIGYSPIEWCSRGERREPLPQYEEWQDEFNKMCESARPTTFVADEWYIENFGENNGK